MIEKILERLEEERKTAYRTYETFEHKVDLGRGFGLEKAIEIVKQEAEKYNNGWIPCSERLPDKKGKYLTTSKIYFVPDHVDEPDNYIGLEITYYSEINGWNGEVIAWQPLPAPYQPKGE